MRTLEPPRLHWLVPIALLSIFILWISTPGPAAKTLISRWRPEPMLTQPETPRESNQPAPNPVSGGAQVAAQFDLSIDDGLYPDQREQLAADLDKAMAYVVSRFGSGPKERFQASLRIDAGCGLHGIAYTDVRNVQTFACNDIGHERAVAIMAHEFVHQLEQDRYGEAHLSSDLILAEGAATWGAGEYWLGGKPDFRAFVREQRANGLFYPLATDYTGLGITAMNALYYQWASFVEYLIGTYGRDKFDAVYLTGGSAPGAADYTAVYGKGLDVLEREWQAWLDT